MKVAEASGDTSSVVRWLTLFGHGYVELNRPEQALDFYDRALKVAGAVPELQLPVMTFLGKSDALVKLDRAAKPRSWSRGARRSQEGRLARLPGGADAPTGTDRVNGSKRRKPWRRWRAPRTSPARPAETGFWAASRSNVLGSCVPRTGRRSGSHAARRHYCVRSMGERLMLPRLLAQLADVQLSFGRRARGDRPSPRGGRYPRRTSHEREQSVGQRAHPREHGRSRVREDTAGRRTQRRRSDEAVRRLGTRAWTLAGGPAVRAPPERRPQAGGPACR